MSGGPGQELGGEVPKRVFGEVRRSDRTTLRRHRRVRAWGPVRVSALHPASAGGGTPAVGQPATGSIAIGSPPRAPVRPVGGSAATWRLLTHGGVRPFLLLLDGLAVLTATNLAGRSALEGLTMLTAVLLLNAEGGLYRSRLTLSFLDDLPSLAGRALVALGMLTSLAVLNEYHASVVQLPRTAALLVTLLIASRAAGYAWVRYCRARGWVAHRTIVLGAGVVGGQIAGHLLHDRRYGLRPVGFLDHDPLLLPAERSVPVLGGLHELAATIATHRVRTVIVAFPNVKASDMVEVLRTCDRLHCEIFAIPRLFELSHFGREIDAVWGVPLMRLHRAAYRSTSWHLKRLFDLVLSSVTLLLVSPLLAVIAAAVRAEVGSGVLFRQLRVGLDGRPFTLLKFRTVRTGPELSGAEAWTVRAADLGPVGRFLRATSLDELPQLWNVLRGEMSLVGPRPERPQFVQQFANSYPHYMARHRVRAGMTGWAQVHGLRGDTSIADRVRFDNSYIESWSLWSDVKILLRTVAQVVGGGGGQRS